VWRRKMRILVGFEIRWRATETERYRKSSLAARDSWGVLE
jgi:hypothetical protein